MLNHVPKKRLIIVDMSSFIFRAFYAIRLLTTPNGTPVNAVYGVLSMLFKLIEDFTPSHFILARDTKEGSFRKEIYPQYKLNRTLPPDELIPQFAIIDQLVEKLGLPSLAMRNYEADDIIGSAVSQWKKEFDEVYIVSGDKDLMQFVGDNVYMVDTKIDKIYGAKEVFEKMGVRPDQIVDYLSMVGDSSDNIPGMKGIGAKGAAQLLAEFGTLDKCIECKDKIKNKRIQTAFESYIQDAHLSKKLVEIIKDIPLGLQTNDIEFKFSLSPDVFDFLNELNFKTQISKLKQLAAKFSVPMSVTKDMIAGVGGIEPSLEKKATHEYGQQLVNVDDEEKIQLLKLKMNNEKIFSLTVAYKGECVWDLQPTSLCLSFDGKSAYVVPSPDENLGENGAIREILRDIWENPELEIVGLDIKKDVAYLFRNEISPRAKFFDVQLAHYIIDVAGKHDLERMASKFLDEQIRMLPSGTNEYLCQMACLIFCLKDALLEEMDRMNLKNIFNEIDGPLIPVLAAMEKEGISINTPFFGELERTFKKELKNLEDKIEALTGDKINLRSPKQVSSLLFEKLNLPVIKKIKTGSSTDSEVLEELDSLDLSEIPGIILRFREVEKLMSTYVTVLPSLINPKTNRIHTSFNQMVTATGRLSSDRPNLQNIPIRTESGRMVRKGFVARRGCLLLSADYSQVELRILAHLSGDETMIHAFQNEQDIHQQTASEVFGVPLEKVSKDLRNKAKAVNFGLIYGQSSFGLAKTLRISRSEAKDYILRYFEKFQRVKLFLDVLKERCTQKGYTETLFGRKRFLPDIHSENRTVKAFAERLSINTPIQGTAADIIKVAMIGIFKKLQQGNFLTKMILQVHDELIFEVPEEELQEVKKIILSEMEGAVTLQVPLKVDVGVGVNWMDLKEF